MNEYNKKTGGCMKSILRPLQNLAEMEAICRQAKKKSWNTGDQVVVWSPRKLILYMGFPGFFPSHLILAEDEKLRKNCMKIIVL